MTARGRRALSAPMDALVRLAAALAALPAGELEPHLGRAMAEAGRVRVEELLLQSHLFLGFPAALAAFEAWRRISPEPAAVSGATEEEARARGERVCRDVYGKAYGPLRRNVRRLHPDLDRWMVAHGYGRVLGRPGLEVDLRELCNVALLAVKGGEPQVHSHLRGALRVGAKPEEVEAALEAGLSRCTAPERAEGLRRLWARVREGVRRRDGGRARDAGRGPGGGARDGARPRHETGGDEEV